MRGSVSIDSETFLMTNFINLKIKSTQSFEVAHRGRVCVHMFIVSARMYISIDVCTVFLKNIYSTIKNCGYYLGQN
jgi:hypothetical protein